MSSFMGRIDTHSIERFTVVPTVNDTEDEGILMPGQFIDISLPGDETLTAIIEGVTGDSYRNQLQREAYQYSCRVSGELPRGMTLLSKSVWEASDNSLAGIFTRQVTSPVTLGTLWGRESNIRYQIDAKEKFIQKHTCIFGSSGSGKTTLLAVLLEELLLRSKARIVILDPNSDFSDFNAPKPGVPSTSEQASLLSMPMKLIPKPKVRPDRFDQEMQRHLLEAAPEICSYESEDSLNPLENNNNRLVQYNLGGILSFSSRAVVAEAVLKKVWDWAESNRGHDTFVVIDEAHNLAPAMTEEASQKRTLAWVNRFSGEGRKYGLYLILVSQRPAKIHSNALDNCRNFMLLRLDNQDDLESLARRTAQVSLELLKRATTFSRHEALLYGDLAPCAIIRPNNRRMGGT
jgi:DNA helicase HerA-like ATPase